ncbi:MAG: hypothetical protein COA82_03560 [Alkaliphilus sp.]|nr:MAG: hypothetical protein COA82_03560 [Alkaliphilus sp.]
MKGVTIFVSAFVEVDRKNIHNSNYYGFIEPPTIEEIRERVRTNIKVVCDIKSVPLSSIVIMSVIHFTDEQCESLYCTTKEECISQSDLEGVHKYHTDLHKDNLKITVGSIQLEHGHNYYNVRDETGPVVAILKQIFYT